jgi:hypothetical protein
VASSMRFFSPAETNVCFAYNASPPGAIGTSLLPRNSEASAWLG